MLSFLPCSWSCCKVSVDVGSSLLADLHTGFPPPHCRLGSTPAFLSGVSGHGLQAQAPLADHEGDQCSTRLSCAREQSKKKALYSINGIVGAVCVHGIPLLGSFCALRGPENFVYYLVGVWLWSCQATKIPPELALSFSRGFSLPRRSYWRFWLRTVDL